MGPDRVASGDNLNVVDGCCYFLIREMVRVEERCEIWGRFESIHDCLYNMVLLGAAADAQFFYGDDILGGLKEDVDCYETEGLTDPEMVWSEGLGTDGSDAFDQEAPRLGIVDGAK